MLNSPLNLAYHGIVLLLMLLLAWNTVFLKEPRKQLMSAVVLIPLLLRFLNLK
jgi:hypothetical protein